ncbi:MAG: hypothetical protein WBO76_09025, partial [Saprospiraceae bacterium]
TNEFSSFYSQMISSPGPMFIVHLFVFKFNFQLSGGSSLPILKYQHSNKPFPLAEILSGN